MAQNILQQRGIEKAALELQWIAAKNPYPKYKTPGFSYPVFKESGEVIAELIRWKAADSDLSPKYVWFPGPEERERKGINLPQYYTPAGLKKAISKKGELHFVSGEPDLLTLREVGFRNVTCAFGERSLSGLVEFLNSMGVKKVFYWRDMDETGRKAAIAFRDALIGSGIDFECRILVGSFEDGYDLNKLWCAVNFDRSTFLQTMQASLAEILPTTKTKRTPSRPKNAPNPANQALYERWCVEVENHAVEVWNLSPANKSGFSQHIMCPFHQEKTESAHWNYQTHGLQCFGSCGKHYNTKEVAEKLEHETFEEFAKRNAPQPPTPPARKSKPSLRTSAKPPKQQHSARHHQKGLPSGYRELLCNWHNNAWVHIEGNDVPRLEGFYTYLTVRYDLIAQGISEPDDALSFHEIANLNRFGLSYKSLSGLEGSLPFELFTFLFPYIESIESYTTSSESSIQETKGKVLKGKEPPNGRPHRKYQLPVIEDMWLGFFEYFRPQMWRALLVAKYRDLPVDLLTYDDVLKARGFDDYDAIGEINDAIHPLLVEHDHRLREAQRELEWRIGRIHKQYINTPPDAYSIAPGITFSRSSQHKDLHLAITLQRDGGEIQNRYAAARAGGWSTPAYQQALKRAGKLLNEVVVTVPNFTERGQITSAVESVIRECEIISQNAYMRGRIKLHAPNGESVTVSPGYARHFNYDKWLLEQGGIATIWVWDRSVDKLQKLVTDQESENRKEVKKRQKAINSRRDYEAEAEARAKSAEEPGMIDQWVDQQGGIVATQMELPTNQWGEIFERVEQKTPSVNKIDGVDGLPLEELRKCTCCGKRAVVQKLGGDYCAEHAALPLHERLVFHQGKTSPNEVDQGLVRVAR